MQFQKARKTKAKERERESDLVRELKLLMDTIPSMVGKARVSDGAKKHAALPMSLLQSLAFANALKGRQKDHTHTGIHTHIHMRSNRRRERQNENVQEVGDRGLLLRNCDSETSLDLLPPRAGFHVGRPPRNPHTRAALFRSVQITFPWPNENNNSISGRRGGGDTSLAHEEKKHNTNTSTILTYCQKCCSLS